MNSSVRPDRQWHRPLGNESDFIDLKKAWRAVWARKWMILLLTLAITALTAFALTRMTPLYKGVTTVVIETGSDPLIDFQPNQGNRAAQANEYIETQIGLMQSRGVAEMVVRDLNLTEHPDFDPRQQPEPLIDIGGMVQAVRGFFGSETDSRSGPLTDADVLDLTTQALMDRTSVWLEGKSHLARIAVEMADPVLAARAANAIAENYVERQLEAKIDSSQEAAGWMRTRLEELRASLEESEERLQAYLDAEGLVDLDGVATISANELSLTGDRMIDAQRQRAEAESQYRQVQAMRSQGWERLASVPAVLSNPLVQQFKAEQAHARAKVEELSRRYGDKHPAMHAAKSDLAAASASLRHQVEQVVAGIERNYQLAVANENALRSSFDANKERIQNISRKEFGYRDLQREVDTNRALYETFMTRLRETTATSDLDANNARIVDRAIPAVEPSAPNKKLFLVVAVVLSLALGIALAIALDMFNTTIRSADEAESKLNLPVLGIVPLVPKKLQKHVAHLFQQDEERRFCEAIRTIRTNIMLNDLGASRQLIVITSSAPGEGKSTVAANMAFAMGQLQKVLLIDADMRRATLAKSFNFAPGTPGLADLMADSAHLHECIQKVGNVDMLSAGSVPGNPLELLASSRFAKLLESVKGHYDRVIIDSPPSLAVSDATLLATLADSVIYVVKSESTSVRQAHKGIAHLSQGGASIMGVVLNQVDVKKARKHDEYSGYYDHYGYSEQTA